MCKITQPNCNCWTIQKISYISGAHRSYFRHKRDSEEWNPKWVCCPWCTKKAKEIK